MLLLAVEGVVMFSSQWSLLPRSYPRRLYLNTHVSIEILAFLGIILGFLSIYINKENNGKPHFKSWHGFFGLIQLILLCAQVLLGTFSRYPKLLPIKINSGKSKTLHVLIGILILFLATTNLVSGFFTDWFVLQTNHLIVYLLSALIIGVNCLCSFNVFLTNSRITVLYKN